MKQYRDTMNGLAFSPEQKQRMVEDLLAAAQTEGPRRRRPRRVWVAAVAALLACLVTACAAGGLSTLAAVFTSLLHPAPTEAQTQTVQQLFTPIGASATDNGVTLTAEGILGDRHNVAILYSIRRDDGTPLLPEGEDTETLSNGDHELLFRAGSAPALSAELTSWGTSPGLQFLDFTPEDTTLYFLDLWTYPADTLPLGGRFQGTFQDLYAHGCIQQPNGASVERDIPLVRGTWALDFAATYEDASVPLPTGQTFPMEDLTATVTDLGLSPLSLHLECDYTADRAALAAGYDPADPALADVDRAQWTDWAVLTQLLALPVTLTFTDGTTADLTLNGSLTGEGHAVLSAAFSTVYPPDTIERITIRDVTIPVAQP